MKIINLEEFMNESKQFNTKYVAYLTQKGEGCDYTIGCGILLIPIDATNMDEAKDKLSEIILEEYFDDTELKKAEIFEINQYFDMPVKEIYKKKEEFERLKKEKDKDEKERKLYDELKKKFEK